MSRPTYTCEFCTAEYVSRVAAIMCCDPAAYGDDD